MNIEKYQKVEVTSQDELRQWLTNHHQQMDPIWLVTFKKIEADKYVSRDQVLDELIAFGWIDGVRSQLDDKRTMQLISPRKTKPWAKSYKVRANRLIAEGKMHPAGLLEVTKAIQSGGWDAMNEVDELVIPNDLAVALKAHEPALAHFENFPASIKRNILRWIASAKTEPTRQKRILMTANEARVNQRVKSHG